MTTSKQREILNDIEMSGCQELNKGSKNKVAKGRPNLLGKWSFFLVTKIERDIGRLFNFCTCSHIPETSTFTALA